MSLRTSADASSRSPAALSFSAIASGLKTTAPAAKIVNSVVRIIPHVSFGQLCCAWATTVLKDTLPGTEYRRMLGKAQHGPRQDPENERSDRGENERRAQTRRQGFQVVG